MFRIRRVFDNVRAPNRDAITQVQQIMLDQFPDLDQRDIDKIPELLENPVKHGFRAILYVAENRRGRVCGFALASHAADQHFCYLDYISAAKQTTGGGIGGALYEQLREEVLALGAVGIFFECLPDDPALCADPKILKQNQARLQFYEKYGAVPIINTAYETPLKPGEDNPPYLVFDPLGQQAPLSRDLARKIVKRILEYRYGHLCSSAYIKLVVESFRDDPVQLRPLLYQRKTTASAVAVPVSRKSRIALVINDRHNIHHVRERGYVESPVRIESIRRELDKTNLFEHCLPRDYSERFLISVHDRDYVDY